MPEPKSALNDTSGSEREPPGSSRSSLVSDGTRRSPARKPHRLLHHRKERQPHPRAALREVQNGNPEAPAAAGARRSKAPGKDCRILPEVRPVHHPQPVPALWILHDEAEDRQTGEAVCSSLCPAAVTQGTGQGFPFPNQGPHQRAGGQNGGLPERDGEDFQIWLTALLLPHEPRNNAPLLKGRAQ